MKKLVKKGGFIIFDNVLFYGKVYDKSHSDANTEGIREINLFISKDPDVERCMITIADGVTIVYLKT